MEDNVLNFEEAGIQFHDYDSLSKNSAIKRTPDFSYCVGQIVNFVVEIPLSKDGREQVKIPHPPRSPASSNLLKCFLRHLASAVDVRTSILPTARGTTVLGKVQETENTVWYTCTLQSSQLSERNPVCLKTEPFLREGKIYTIPFQMRLLDIPSSCESAELLVELRQGQRRGPGWLSSPTRPDSVQFNTDVNSCANRLQQRLKVIHPPDVKFQHKSVAGKQLLLLQVFNNTSNPISIEECSILPETCPVKLCKQPTDLQTGGIRKPCLIHGNMVRLLSGEPSVLPTLLLPEESISLMYNLHLIGGADYLAKEDISFHGHLKWNIPDRTSQSDILTAYSLPTVRIRQAQFVMSAKCKEDNLQSGDIFTVHYSVNNRLQDFLSVKLYWGPTPTAGSVEEGEQLQCLKHGLLCCDPQVQLGACPYGSVMQAQVRFQALRPGLYEVCKHMKINLRYLLPSEGDPVPASPASHVSSLSGDDQLTSEEIWRERSGSGSSFKEPEGLAAERRLSLANKSYSVGDLVDNVQSPKTKSSEGRKVPFGGEKQNCGYEQMLLNPANFLKNSCEVYVTAPSRSKQHSLENET